MDYNLIGELVNLMISVVIAVVVMRHFQKRLYPLHLKYSTFWPRFWSPTIDSIILWPLTVLIPVVLEATIFKTRMASWVIACLASVIQFSYSICLNGRYGGTIGKLQCNLRILDNKTERPISYQQAILRDAVPLVLLLILCVYSISNPAKFEDMTFALYISAAYGLWFLAEILTMLTNSKRRALHDYIAGTVVVRTNITENFSNHRVEPTRYKAR